MRKIMSAAALAAATVMAQPAFTVADFAWSERPVAGKPYAAENTTETIQTLADGNRIVRKNSSKVFRDGQGRTRREQTFEMFGAQTPAKPVELVTIQDPVAQTTYTLDQDRRVARKLMAPNMAVNFQNKITDAAAREAIEKKMTGIKRREAGTVEYQPGQLATEAIALAAPVAEPGVVSGNVRVAVTGPVAIRERMPMPPGGDPAAGVVRERRAANTADVLTFERVAAPGMPGAGGAVFFRREAGSPANVEQLGVRSIEGVECTGTRRTTKIPAGSIGNERELVVVTEEWFSPRLDTIVLAKTIDPRHGETTHRLTRITLDEPAPHLFQVPAGYTVEEGPSPGKRIMLKDE